jgi:2-keto-4-pentenoate hydratase/2-oxohepta-3-ene-1,7-dioic acid hydratase in catechol pathway
MKKIKIKNSSKEYTIRKIVCVGKNYEEHVKELGGDIPEKPVIFLKPASSVIYSNDKVIKPSFTKDLHHEAELVLLIGSKIKNGDMVQAENAIIGYGVGLDMTLRDVQNELKKKGNPWTISKCFDTSAVLSEFVMKKDHKLTLEEEITLTVNGTTKQKEKLKLMIVKPVELVQYISSLMTLEEGDLIYTGTPAGVSRVEPGDKLHVSITGIADLDCSIA